MAFLYANEKIEKRKDGGKKERKKGTGCLHVYPVSSLLFLLSHLLVLLLGR
jgi:hypothetical protein